MIQAWHIKGNCEGVHSVALRSLLCSFRWTETLVTLLSKKNVNYHNPHKILFGKRPITRQSTHLNVRLMTGIRCMYWTSALQSELSHASSEEVLALALALFQRTAAGCHGPDLLVMFAPKVGELLVLAIENLPVTFL